MRKGRHQLCRGFRAARHLCLAAAPETFCWRGRALPSPNMAGGEVVTCSWGWRCPSRAALCGAATWARAVSAGRAAGAARAGGEGGRRGGREGGVGSGQAGEPPAARVFAAAGPEGVPGSPAGRCQAAAPVLRLLGAGAVAWREGAQPGRAGQPRPEGCARGAVPAPAAGAWRLRGGAGGFRSSGWCLVSARSPHGAPSQERPDTGGTSTRPRGQLRCWLGSAGLGWAAACPCPGVPCCGRGTRERWGRGEGVRLGFG